MQAEQQSERERFEAWAKDEGYDTANTYDTERSRWRWLNPMTSDLWKSWRAALSHPSTPQGWKLVPVEPTLDMGWAYLDAARADDPRGAEELRFSWPGYRAMLNAAPLPVQ